MPERLRRLHLALVDRVDAGADDLPHVRALVDAEREDPGDDGAVETEQPEVERVRDEREAEAAGWRRSRRRRSARAPACRGRPDVDAREPAQRRRPRHPHERRDEAEHHADELGADRDVDGRLERADEHVVRVEDPLPDDVPVDRGEHRRLLLHQGHGALMPHLARIFFIVPLA